MTLTCESANACARLCFHRQSLRGSVIDLIIHFNQDETAIDSIVDKTFDLFQHVDQELETCTYKARLIAECEYQRLNEVQDVIETVSYHFGSYSSERVTNAQSFYTRHLEKIASRMDTFHRRGSNLVFQRIKHIHIALSIESGCLPANFID